MNPNPIRAVIIAIGMVGTLVFGSAFVLSFLNPGLVEKIGKNIIRYQIEKKVHEKIDALDAGTLAKQAARHIKGFDADIADAKRKLAAGLPEKIAAVIAEMGNLDCECRKKIEKSIHDGYLWQITHAAQAQEKLNSLIRTKYMETAEQLTREFRIFTGSNAVVFALLAIAGLIKKKAGVHLMPIAVVLVAAAGATAYLYLFNQNWLHTLVFSDYLGLAYVAYLSLVFAWLSDVIFNRARVTSAILSNIPGSLVVAPC